jgi:hypothetical protein
VPPKSDKFAVNGNSDDTTVDHHAHMNGHMDEPPRGCPFFNGKPPSKSQQQQASKPPEYQKQHSITKKFPEWQTSISVASEPVLYTDYLQLDKILNAQFPASQKYGNLAHDEHLFIVVHQGNYLSSLPLFLQLFLNCSFTCLVSAYEIWFKQIIFEIDSIISLLAKPVCFFSQFSLTTSDHQKLYDDFNTCFTGRR